MVHVFSLSFHWKEKKRGKILQEVKLLAKGHTSVE